jgi:predicted PurR-regulated permease PerM
MPTQKRLQVISFLLIVVVLAVLVFFVVRPFWDMLTLAFILAVLFHAVTDRLEKVFRSRSLAALVTLGIMLVIVLIPFALIGQALFSEAVGLYNRVSQGGAFFNTDQLSASVPAQVRGFVDGAIVDLNALISGWTGHAFSTVSSVLSNVAGFLLAVFLTLFATYYFLKDGRKFEQVLIEVSPIDNGQEQVLFAKITKAVHGVVKGQFLTALIQGVVATIGYTIFGVPDPLLWGLFTAMAALVPTVGTSLATIPAVLYLLLTGQVGSAVGLIIWGAFAVGLIDNVVGPRVLGHTTQIHPLLMFIAVLGGVSAFGFIGFLLGPILMAVFVAVVDMYRTEFKTFIS